MTRAEKIEQTALKILGAGAALWAILAARESAKRKATEDYYSEKAEQQDGVGMIGDRTFEYRPDRRESHEHLVRIFAYEPYFGKKVWVGTINHKLREIYPSHGYFYPHKYGKLMKNVAKQMGYTFNNN